MEFAAYQMSIEPAAGSVAQALPASVYAFPALSVIPRTVGSTSGAEAQPTTIRLPFPVAGIVHVDVGNVCGPQEVTWTRLMAGGACVKLRLQLLEPPGPKTVGLQAKVGPCTCASRPTVAVCELPPRVAVTVAL